MSALEDARAEVARLEKQQSFEQAVADAGADHEANPSQETLAAHDAACVALAQHQAAYRTEGGPTVGGDAVLVPEQSTEGGE